MHTSLKFLALLALPLAGLVANASPIPDTSLDISIVIAEHDENFVPGRDYLISSPASTSLQSHPFSAQHDIHNSVAVFKKFEWFQDEVHILGYIYSDYYFAAVISTFDHAQNVAGNARDGYDANIDLGIAFSRLRFSLENDSRLFVARGSLEYTEGRNVKIDAVLVDYLATSTSQDINNSNHGIKNYAYRQGPLTIQGWIDDYYNFEASIAAYGSFQVVSGKSQYGYFTPITLPGRPEVTGDLRFSIKNSGRAFVVWGFVSYFGSPSEKIDAVLVNDLTATDTSTPISDHAFDAQQNLFNLDNPLPRDFEYHSKDNAIAISGVLNRWYEFQATISSFQNSQPVIGKGLYSGTDIIVNIPGSETTGNLKFSLEDGGKTFVVRGFVSARGHEYKIDAVLLDNLPALGPEISQTSQSQSIMNLADTRQDWFFKHSDFFILDGYIENGLILHAWISLEGKRFGFEIHGSLRGPVFGNFAIDGKKGRTTGYVLFQVKEKTLWVKADLDIPDGPLAFESPITPVRDYPYYDRIEV